MPILIARTQNESIYPLKAGTMHTDAGE